MAVINFTVVPPFAEVVDPAPRRNAYRPGSRALHAAHTVELADVIRAREQSRAYRGKARDGQGRSRDVLHCSSPSRAPGAACCARAVDPECRPELPVPPGL
jgi:hypothetical protein